MGYTEPTPIQAQAIPPSMEGKDVIGVAQTGTGKTAAFLLPILHQLQTGPEHTTRALIIAPTRELALQIDEVRVGLTYHTTFSGCCVYGGANMLNQTRALKGGPDVVTATPGRLIDHLWHGLPKLDQVQTLVLDEADRMLDMGFLPDIEKIIRRLPEQRQNLLFSATMPKEIERLAREIMTDPVNITVGKKSQPVDRINQELHVLSPNDKLRHLVRLVKQKDVESALIFTRTKSGANQVFTDLRKARVEVAVIHGDRAQEERIRSLESFKQGTIRVLVATDVASRGIDVDGISHVINYDVPRSPDDYVHRIGRTARAGEYGNAFTFVTPAEERDVKAIERQIEMRITRVDGDGRRTPGTSPKSSGGDERDERRDDSSRSSSSRGSRGSSSRDSSRGDSRRDSSRGDSRRDSSRGDSRRDTSRGDSRHDSSRSDSRRDSSRGDSRHDSSRGDSRRDSSRSDSRRDSSRGDSRRDSSRSDSRRDSSRGDSRRDFASNESSPPPRSPSSGGESSGRRRRRPVTDEKPETPRTPDQEHEVAKPAPKKKATKKAVTKKAVTKKVTAKKATAKKATAKKATAKKATAKKATAKKATAKKTTAKKTTSKKTTAKKATAKKTVARTAKTVTPTRSSTPAPDIATGRRRRTGRPRPTSND